MNNVESTKDNIPMDAENFAVNPADTTITAPEPDVDADELAIAEKEAAESGDTYTYTFRKPVSYNNLTIVKMTFDWGSLTGRDAIAIENEMQTLGKMVVVPVFSGEYLIRMAARACDQKIGTDFFENISLGEYNKIRSAARSFLLKSE